MRSVHNMKSALVTRNAFISRCTYCIRYMLFSEIEYDDVKKNSRMGVLMTIISCFTAKLIGESATTNFIMITRRTT